MASTKTGLQVGLLNATWVTNCGNQKLQKSAQIRCRYMYVIFEDISEVYPNQQSPLFGRTSTWQFPVRFVSQTISKSAARRLKSSSISLKRPAAFQIEQTKTSHTLDTQQVEHPNRSADYVAPMKCSESDSLHHSTTRHHRNGWSMSAIVEIRWV